MVEEVKQKEFIPVATNVHAIKCPKAWKQLGEQEKKYAYYMTRAAWEGSKVCWF